MGEEGWPKMNLTGDPHGELMDREGSPSPTQSRSQPSTIPLQSLFDLLACHPALETNTPGMDP